MCVQQKCHSHLKCQNGTEHPSISSTGLGGSNNLHRMAADVDVHGGGGGNRGDRGGRDRVRGRGGAASAHYTAGTCSRTSSCCTSSCSCCPSPRRPIRSSP